MMARSSTSYQVFDLRLRSRSALTALLARPSSKRDAAELLAAAAGSDRVRAPLDEVSVEGAIDSILVGAAP